MIEKFNYVTPGREADDEDVKLINKKEYKEYCMQVTDWEIDHYLYRL